MMQTMDTEEVKNAAAEGSMTSFPEALIVHQLAQQCIRAVTGRDRQPGSGLKKLRLISKDVRDILQQLVQGYTLPLGVEAWPWADTHEEVKFLRSLHLLSLRISFPPMCSLLRGGKRCDCRGDCTKDADGLAMESGTIQHSAQLHSFLEELGPSLSNLTRLHITLPKTEGCDSVDTAATLAATELLLPLASLCPLLVELRVTGRYGTGLLQAFGALCPKLTSLHTVLTNITTGTLEHLGTLLPHLTSLVVLTCGAHEMLYTHIKAREDERIAACCAALRACPKLLSFEDTCAQMKEQVWDALPHGLQSCITLGIHDNVNARIPIPVPKWRQHPSVRRLTLTCGCVSLHQLVLFLSATPGLSVLVIEREELFCPTRSTDGLAEEMCLVDARMVAGLVIAGREVGACSKTAHPISIELHLHLDSLEEMPSFLTDSMPALPSFPRLTLTGSSVRTGDVFVVSRKIQLDFSQVPRVFPCLQELKLQTLDVRGLLVLALCPALRSLGMVMCDGVTPDGLAMLCAESKSLQVVSCAKCRGISAEDKHLMESEGWGETVRVVVESLYKDYATERREEEKMSMDDDD